MFFVVSWYIGVLREILKGLGGSPEGPKRDDGKRRKRWTLCKDTEFVNEVNWRGSGGGHVGVASKNRVGDSKILIIPWFYEQI